MYVEGNSTVSRSRAQGAETRGGKLEGPLGNGHKASEEGTKRALPQDFADFRANWRMPTT